MCVERNLQTDTLKRLLEKIRLWHDLTISRLPRKNSLGSLDVRFNKFTNGLMKNLGECFHRNDLELIKCHNIKTKIWTKIKDCNTFEHKNKKQKVVFILQEEKLPEKRPSFATNHFLFKHCWNVPLDLTPKSLSSITLFWK